MNTVLQKSPYRIDLKLAITHILLLLIGYLIYKYFPHTPNERDMSGLFFMIISVLGGFIGLIILAVSLPRLDRTITNLKLFKFILAFVYWLSSSIIFILLGTNRFFYNNPYIFIIFALIFYTTLYFSIIRLADMHKENWILLIGILGLFILFINK